MNNMQQMRSQSLVDDVYQSLKERIFRGDFAIGDQIPTEAEIAAEFDCGRGTVSKAITRLVHDGLVQRRTRTGTRVLKTSVDKKPDRIQVDACAFIYPSQQHEGIWRILEGFQRAAHEVDRRVVTLTTGTDFRQEAEIIGRLDEFDVKGAVAYPVLPEPDDRLHFAQMLLKCRFPVVLADITIPGFSENSVVIDSFHAGYTMTRHLLGQGLRKIGFLANYAWTPSVQKRHEGYRWALEEAGVAPQPELELMEPSIHPDFQLPVEKSHSLTTQYLSVARGMEGVVCANDFLALSCLDSAQKLGLRVPEDLKVVGIDDFAVSARSELTTYHVPFEEMGRRSFQMLNGLIQGKSATSTESSFIGVGVATRGEQSLRGSLVVRKTG